MHGYFADRLHDDSGQIARGRGRLFRQIARDPLMQFRQITRCQDDVSASPDTGAPGPGGLQNTFADLNEMQTNYTSFPGGRCRSQESAVVQHALDRGYYMCDPFPSHSFFTGTSFGYPFARLFPFSGQFRHYGRHLRGRPSRTPRAGPAQRASCGGASHSFSSSLCPS